MIRKSNILIVLCVITGTISAKNLIRSMEWTPNAVVVEALFDATSVTAQTEHGTAVTTSLVNCEMDRGIYVVPVHEGEMLIEAGQTITLAFNHNGTPVAQTTLRIPLIIDTIATLSDYDVSLCEDADLVILNGGVLTVNPEAEVYAFRNILIMGGGRLVVPEDASLIADTIFLRAGEVRQGNYVFAYPEMVVRGCLRHAHKTIYYDYLLSDTQYYSLSVAKDIPLSSLTYEDGQTIKLGKNMDIAVYDGGIRAGGNNGWIPFTGTMLQRGIGYTITAEPQFIRLGTLAPVRRSRALVRIPYNIDFSAGDTLSAISVPVTPHPAQAVNDAGWNLVGNPYMSAYIGGVQGLSSSNGIGLLDYSTGEYQWIGNLRYVVIPADNGRSYYPMMVNNAILPPFKNFFIQIGEGDALQFEPNGQRANSPLRAQRQGVDVVVGINLYEEAQPTIANDKLGIVIGQQYTDAYEMNADLAKFAPNEDVNIYATIDNQELCFAAINESSAQRIPIGLTVSTAGTYTFALDSCYDRNMVASVLLMDADAHIVTDLMTQTYSFDVQTTKTYNSRFSLTINLKNIDISTAAETIRSSNSPTKYWKNGRILICRDEKLYTLLGEQIQ